ncbi:MAG: hypothetical protein QM731_03195 [Chitinophagaceae bacterium]
MFNTLEQFYYDARRNKWFRYFTVFCRVALAAGFIPSGIVKIMGERFTALPSNHPLGHYFDVLYQTGFYYTFIGVGQIITALLLLIPRTALLGALIYFPTILNICVLAYATRFEGTRITTMMLLANIYLLCWDYERIKHILPFKQAKTGSELATEKTVNNRFPFVFFGGVVAAVALVIIINAYIFDIRPGNSMIECTNGCKGSKYPKASCGFCDCIYSEGKPLDSCLKEYKLAKERERNDSLGTTISK